MSIDAIKLELRHEVNDYILDAIGLAISDAYRHLNVLTNDEKFLNGRTGIEVRPHVRKAVVDWFLKQLQPLGLGITCTEVSNEINNSWHVELRIGRFVLTHNFVHDQEEHPRDCEFRKNLLLKNIQLSMYDEQNNVLRVIQEAEDISNDLIYGQIIHGGNQHLSFILLCLPNHDGTEWIDKLRIPIHSGQVPTEEIPPTDSPPLKEYKKQKEDLDDK